MLEGSVANTIRRVTLSRDFVRLSIEANEQIKVQEDLNTRLIIQSSTIRVKNTLTSLNLEITSSEEISVKDENSNWTWDTFKTRTIPSPPVSNQLLKKCPYALLDQNGDLNTFAIQMYQAIIRLGLVASFQEGGVFHVER